MRMLKLQGTEIVIEPELLGLPQFRVVWNRDKSARKSLATAEITYIYYMYGFDSPYTTYAERERKQVIIDNFHLNALAKKYGKKGINYVSGKWVKDKRLLECIKLYNELQLSVSAKALINLRETLHTSNDTLAVMRIEQEEMMAIYKEEMAEYKKNKEWDDEIEPPVINITELIKQQTAILKLANELPKTVKVVDEMYEKAISAREDMNIFGQTAMGEYEE